MRFCELEVLTLGEDSLHLVLHIGVGLIGGCNFGCVFGDSGCVLVFVDLEVFHIVVYDGHGVVESQIVNCSAGFSEFKVSFLEVVFEVIPSFVGRIGAFPCPDVVFEN